MVIRAHEEWAIARAAVQLVTEAVPALSAAAR
jgi:hypothetical protein